MNTFRQNRERQNKMKKVIMADVARAARVSVKTVSRVINKEEGVGKEKRREIERLVAELKFVPDPSARTLSSAKTDLRSFNIGLLTSDVVDRFYFGALQIGAGNACQASGYHLIIEEIESYPAFDSRFFEAAFSEMNLDGIILPPGLCDNNHLIKFLGALKVPFVRISPVDLNVVASSVQIDEQGAAYDLTRYLVADGHRDIGFITENNKDPNIRSRMKGYVNCLIDSGLSINSDWICGSEPAAIEAMLNDRNRPTAIFASSDILAFRVMAMAAKVGLTVPDDVSLVGFGDARGAETVWPPLTTVRQPVSEFGTRAVALLLGQLGGKFADRDHVTETLDYSIIERQSVRSMTDRSV